MRVRALLIVNPRAPTTPNPRREAIVPALAARTRIEVVETRHRGDARDIAARAADEGWDALLVLSGDGTINEAVNGLMDKARARPGQPPAGAGAGAGAGAEAGAEATGGGPARELPA